MTGNNDLPLSPKDRERLITAAKFNLFVLGYGYKRTAKEIGLSDRTLFRWAKKYKWDTKLKNRYRQRENNSVRYDDSLTAYMMFVKAKYPQDHENDKQKYEHFLKML